MTRHIARLAGVVCLMIGAAVAVAPPASAVLPDRVGWWNKLQQIPVLPVAGPVNLPLPPVVSSDDLPVVADTTADGSIMAALRYIVPPGASATLTLVDTNDRPIVMPPGAAIRACPTTKVWDGLINGRWDARPTYDCVALSATSSPTADGLGLTWDFPAAFQTSPGAIDIALVPSGSFPFAAVFSGPTAESLVLTNVPETAEEVQAELSTAPPVYAPSESFSYDGFTDTLGVSDFGAALPSLRPGGANGRVAPGGENRRFVTAGAPSLIPDSRAERTMAFLLLVALAGGLFWFGGQPARAPRLLGSLGNGQTASITASSVAGVGRFARPRGGLD